MSGFRDPSVFCEEVRQISVCKEEDSPEQQQEKSFSLDQEIAEPRHIKEEPEEVWSNQEGERLLERGEDNIIKFTYFPVSLKSEEDEDNSEEMEAGADGEEWEEPGAARYFDPETDLPPETEVKTEGFSDPETDDSADWMESTGQHSGLNSMDSIKIQGLKTNKKSHCCSECEKTFSQKCNLQRHMLVHTRQKPFSCSECSKTFSLKSHLTRHIRTHTGEKPYSCSECGKLFNHNGNLNKHMLVHTRQKPFSCPECGKRFTQKGSMSKHMRIHSGEKPFNCFECGKRFTLKEYLTQHMRIHAWEKPFGCPECGKRFNHQRSMTRHTVIHTRENHIPALSEVKNVT